MNAPGPRFSVEDGYDYAKNLVFELYPHIGDRRRVAEICKAWADDIGPDQFAMTAVAVVDLAFTNHLKNIVTETPEENS